MIASKGYSISTVVPEAKLPRVVALVTFLVGICGSAVTAFFAWFISGSIAIAAVMMAAMIGNMLIGAALGVMIPILRDRFGNDPAVGSSVLLTFATDSLGFLLFLGLATVFLL